VPYPISLFVSFFDSLIDRLSSECSIVEAYPLVSSPKRSVKFKSAPKHRKSTKFNFVEFQAIFKSIFREVSCFDIFWILNFFQIFFNFFSFFFDQNSCKFFPPKKILWFFSSNFFLGHNFWEESFAPTWNFWNTLFVAQKPTFIFFLHFSKFFVQWKTFCFRKKLLLLGRSFKYESLVPAESLTNAFSGSKSSFCVFSAFFSKFYLNISLPKNRPTHITFGETVFIECPYFLYELLWDTEVRKSEFPQNH